VNVACPDVRPSGPSNSSKIAVHGTNGRSLCRASAPFKRSGVKPCLLERPPLALDRRRVDPVRLPTTRGERGRLRGTRPAGPAFRQCRVDLLPAPAEELAHLPRNPSDLGDPVANRGPLDPEHPGQLGSENGLVDQAGRASVRVDLATIECRPAVVGAACDVRDQRVGVELGIAGARSPMAERRRDHDVGPLDDHTRMAATDRDRGPFEVLERLRDRCSMCAPGGVPRSGIAEPEQDADALRRRERQIERTDASPLRRVPQLRPGPRTAPGEQRPEIITGYRPGQAEPGSRTPGPFPARPSLLGVVVLQPLGDAVDNVDPPLRLVEVVAGLAGHDLADREHRVVLDDSGR
jgi:hypothetical protein